MLLWVMVSLRSVACTWAYSWNVLIEQKIILCEIGYRYKCRFWQRIKGFPCLTMDQGLDHYRKLHKHIHVLWSLCNCLCWFCWMWCFCSGSLFTFSWSRVGQTTSKICKTQTIKCLRELSTLEELQNKLLALLARDNNITLWCMVPAVPFLSI